MNRLPDVVAIGAINWDTNIWVDEFASIGEEVAAKRVSRVPGGKAANVAVAAARILGKKRVALFGAVGKDDIGRAQLKILVEEGVDTSYIKSVSHAESGQAYITIDRDGSNFIETLFGANSLFFPEDLLRTFRLSAIRKCKVVAISDPLISTAERIAALGSEHGATVLFDAGSKLQVGLKGLREVLRSVTILILNSVESNRLTGSADPPKVREKLKEEGLDIAVLVKLGEKGCAYSGRNDETLRLPALPLEELGLRVANTTGCGDAFLGVMAASISQGFSLADSLERATVAGGLKAIGSDTRCSPRKQELDETLELWRKRH